MFIVVSQSYGFSLIFAPLLLLRHLLVHGIAMQIYIEGTDIALFCLVRSVELGYEKERSFTCYKMQWERFSAIITHKLGLQTMLLSDTS